MRIDITIMHVFFNFLILCLKKLFVVEKMLRSSILKNVSVISVDLVSILIGQNLKLFKFFF